MSILLLARSHKPALPAETVGEAQYTYIGANHYQFQDVATHAIELLQSVGWGDKTDIRIEFIGQQRAEQILNAASGYGGVLIYVGHGDAGWVTLEPYPHRSIPRMATSSRLNC